MKQFSIMCLLAGIIATQGVSAEEVIRHKIPNSDFPIALAVEVPANKTLVFVSGGGPVPIAAADKATSAVSANTPAAFGNTRTQTVSTLTKIQNDLKRLGLDMKDVVKMQVFLVGDAELKGEMDFAGFMEGYKQFFGTAKQPNLPARSLVKVAGLVNPGWLVEIEVTAVRH
ncbi:MAG: RidA family protein [Pseudomonadota bacterium]